MNTDNHYGLDRYDRCSLNGLGQDFMGPPAPVDEPAPIMATPPPEERSFWGRFADSMSARDPASGEPAWATAVRRTVAPLSPATALTPTAILNPLEPYIDAGKEAAARIARSAGAAAAEPIAQEGEVQLMELAKKWGPIALITIGVVVLGGAVVGGRVARGGGGGTKTIRRKPSTRRVARRRPTRRVTRPSSRRRTTRSRRRR